MSSVVVISVLFPPFLLSSDTYPNSVIPVLPMCSGVDCIDGVNGEWMLMSPVYPGDGIARHYIYENSQYLILSFTNVGNGLCEAG